MKVSKPWGHEIIWAQTTKYVGKILVVRAGERLSLQHHEYKEESLYVRSGKVIILLEDENGVFVEHTLLPTEHIDIPSGHRHRLSAIEDSEIFEVSTPHLSDVIRHEDDYGR
jgi:mannose-6-phosphate isomerase-like protein (cupin superfamily)